MILPAKGMATVYALFAAAALAPLFSVAAAAAYSDLKESLKSPEEQMTDIAMRQFTANDFDPSQVTRTQFDPKSLTASFTATKENRYMTVNERCVAQQSFGGAISNVNCSMSIVVPIFLPAV